jgi:NitT/TauT family transport system permease protein
MIDARPAAAGVPLRPEVVRTGDLTHDFGVVEKPLSVWERLYAVSTLRKVIILTVLAIIWQVYAQFLNNELLVPTLSSTAYALWDNIVSGILPYRIAYTLKVLLMGYAAGLFIAAILTAVAIGSQIGQDILETFTSMFNPLPAIALLPLALIWFGLGNGSLVFVLIHSVLWAVALNTHSGFKSVSQTMRMVGRNYGLVGWSYIIGILIPAAFPSILAGLKIGWAFAWRTLIAAELVFGVSSGGGGLGWFIFERKNELEIPSVFAGLLCIVLIGLIVENLIFRTIEKRTVSKWGMQA